MIFEEYLLKQKRKFILTIVMNFHSFIFVHLFKMMLSFNHIASMNTSVAVTATTTTITTTL